MTPSGRAADDSAAEQAPQARYYTTGKQGLVCTLCPHGCILTDGQTGTCGVRQNQQGSLTLPYFGQASALNIDPIEKKPLYHFIPGSAIVSIGFLGCNFHCPFCQNYSISQDTRHASEYVSPERLVALAADARSAARRADQPPVAGIAYTYNEPSIHFEYIAESASLAAEAGLANVLVTNGHLNPQPASEILQMMDAVNVDLKSMSSEFYRDELGGSLKAVKRFIALAAETTHVEVTTLLLPGKNDSDAEVHSVAAFLADLRTTIPLHLSAYHPAYRYSLPPTDHRRLLHSVDIAHEKLPYVYAGNLGTAATTTCLACGAALVRRHGYHVDRSGLDHGECVACGKAAAVVDA
jgi:pyruvate formate lyase activating enzyme